MSKKATRFQKSSGWSSRPSGGGGKEASPKPSRSDVSMGSQRMADGGKTSNREVDKHRLITQVKVWHKEGKIGDMVKCPFCKCPVSVHNFARHVRRLH